MSDFALQPVEPSEQLENEIQELYREAFWRHRNWFPYDFGYPTLPFEFHYKRCMNRAYQQLAEPLAWRSFSHEDHLNIILTYHKNNELDFLRIFVQCVKDTLRAIMTSIQGIEPDFGHVFITRFPQPDTAELEYEVSVWNINKRKWYTAFLIQGSFESEQEDNLYRTMYLSEFRESGKPEPVYRMRPPPF